MLEHFQTFISSAGVVAGKRAALDLKPQEVAELGNEIFLVEEDINVLDKTIRQRITDAAACDSDAASEVPCELNRQELQLLDICLHEFSLTDA
jgi:hypothetical protein